MTASKRPAGQNMLPFNNHDLTMGIENGVMFAKETGASLVLPVHMQHPNPKMNPNLDELVKELESKELNYKVLDINESIEI